ncbi:MAG: hypothetical protein ABIV63_19540 [Caldimonas sp.]
MKLLVTGSAGHLGGARMRSLPARGHDAIGVDIRPSAFTQRIGSVADRAFVAECMRGIDGVLHKRHCTSRMSPRTRSRRSSTRTSAAR